MKTLKDAIYALAIGDALGFPVQFKERGSFHIEDMIDDDYLGLPKGSWSDDTSLTIALCDSIKQTGCIDVLDIRQRFVDWLHNGKYTPFGFAYDIGLTCEKAIIKGKGIDEKYANGNGSLMRILPLAFVENVTDQDIEDVSAITHAHKISKEGCVIYIHIAQGLLQGKPLKQCILENVDETSIYHRLLTIETQKEEDISSSGYVVDTLEAALWCLMTTDNLKDCLIKAVNLGDDSDTVGAVAGGLAGIIYGLESIPSSWLDSLQAKELIEKTLFK